MTREETVKWLESLKSEIGKSEHRTLWHYAESIDMAIEALSERNIARDIATIIENEQDMRVMLQNAERPLTEEIALSSEETMVIQTGQTYGKSAYIKELAEVVRCKDCRHYRSDGGALMVCDVSDIVVNDDDFCSYGERR